MKQYLLSFLLILCLTGSSHAAGSKCYPAPFNASNFTTDLFTAFPAWRTLGGDGFYRTDVTITYSATQVCVTWLDSTTVAQVDPVFTAHITAPTVTFGNAPKMIKVFTLTIDPPAVPANTTQPNSITIPGINVGDIIMISKPTLTPGCFILNSLVTAPDTLSMGWRNLSASACDPPLETYKILVIRP